MESYVLPLLTTSIVVSIIGIVAPARIKSRSFQMLIGLCVVVVWWHGSWALLFTMNNERKAAYVAKFGHIGILLLPVAFRQYYKTLFDIKLNEKWIFAVYGILLTFLLTTDLVVSGVYSYAWGYYPKGGPLHPVFLAFIALLLTLCVRDGMAVLKSTADPLKRRAANVGMLACFVFTLGSYDFLINYKIVSTYPYGFVSSILFVMINAYGLIEYDLFKKQKEFSEVKKVTENLEVEISQKETKLDELRATMINREKLATLGMLSSGVAHQLGNTLNVISASNVALSIMAQKESIVMESFKKCIARTNDAVSLSKDIIASLNSIGKENDVFKINSLRKIANSGMVLTKGKSLENVRVYNEISPELMVHCSSSSLTQVFMNLLSNSVDAMSKPNGEIHIRASLEANGFIAFSIRDSGDGIPLKLQKTLFDPFVTSKSSDDGTGLGLYLVKKEVDLHRGQITFETGPQGTTFTIRLPQGLQS